MTQHMKISFLRYAALLASAGCALLTSTAQAVNDYDDGDLLLGIRASGSPGFTQDIVVNLGSVTQFVETGTTTTTVGPNLKARLDGIYGTEWASRADMHWSVSGAVQFTNVGGFGPKTLWATRARLDFAPATPWERQSETAQAFTSNKMSGLATVYNTGTLTSGVLVEFAAGTNSYSSYMPGGTVTNSAGISFATFSPSIEGTPGQALDLFRMEPGNGAGTFVGRFSLMPSGALLFTPRDGAGGGFTSVKIDQAAYTVPIDVGGAQVKLVRTGDPLFAFDVTANTTDDTAQAGVHFTGVTNEIISFGPNEGEKILNIPITDIDGSQPVRSFTATISAAPGGVTVGTPNVTTVTIAESGPAECVLSAAGYTVTEGNSAAVVVRRLGNSASTASVQLLTAPGNATTADFTGVSQQVDFTPGGPNEITVNIQTTPDALAEFNETFTVRLQPVGGSTVGSPNSAPVTIIDPSSAPDTSNPGAPSFSAPAANALFASTITTINFTGTAGDNKGVQTVEYRVSSGTGTPNVWTPATLGTPGGNMTTFTAPITPGPGANTVEVRSKDFRAVPGPNQSAVVSRTIISTRPLEVTVEGAGALTAGFLNVNEKEPGKSYTIVASPGTGSIFKEWTIESTIPTANEPSDIGVAPSALEKPTLTFLFREGLKLKATFVDSPFDNGLAGTYWGLISASGDEPDRPTGADGSLPSNSTEGLFKATVMNTGGFSGILTIDGFVLNVAGTLDHTGKARFGTARAKTITVARLNKPSYVAEFGVSLTAPFKVTGKVTATDFKKSSLPVSVSDVEADRAHYTGATTALTVPDPYLTVTGTAPSPTGRTDGKFTVVFPSLPEIEQPAGLKASDYPAGDGVGAVTVNKNGTITITGTLADSTTFTMTTALSVDNTFPLFVPLYNKLGFVGGKISLNSTDPSSDMAALADLKWSRPFMLTQQWYPYGWPEVLKLGMVGAKYLVNGGPVLKAANNTPIGSPDTDGNADLQFTLGLLTAPIDRAVNITGTSTVAKVPDNDPTFLLSINPTTGVVTGSFTHEDDTKTPYQATIFQKGPDAGAYGFFLTTRPPVLDYLGESGRVTLSGQP
jgi:hypothetical protein